MIRTITLVLILCLSGCGTLSAARPMEAGEHRVGATFGGPFTTALGPPIPVPNLIIEGRSGLDPIGEKPVDVNYGINATGIAFGQLGLHGGASIHLLEPAGARPGLAITERLHIYNNYFDTTKPLDTRMFWGLSELDLTTSWALREHRLYAGVSNIVDLADPELLIAPFLGMELQPADRKVCFQIESRVLGANFSPDVWDVTWLTLGGTPGYGLVSVTLSASWAIGDTQ